MISEIREQGTIAVLKEAMQTPEIVVLIAGKNK
jgi:hypothetical protein